jgi:hypothetical protein
MHLYMQSILWNQFHWICTPLIWKVLKETAWNTLSAEYGAAIPTEALVTVDYFITTAAICCCYREAFLCGFNGQQEQCSQSQAKPYREHWYETFTNTLTRADKKLRLSSYVLPCSGISSLAATRCSSGIRSGYNCPPNRSQKDKPGNLDIRNRCYLLGVLLSNAQIWWDSVPVRLTARQR